MLREGNLLVLAHTTLEVAEACSGIRSLVAHHPGHQCRVFHGFAYVGARADRGVSRPGRDHRECRARGGTGMMARWIGPEAADGFFHEFSGWIVFLFAFVMILIIQRLILKLAPKTFASSGISGLPQEGGV